MCSAGKALATAKRLGSQAELAEAQPLALTHFVEDAAEAAKSLRKDFGHPASLL